MTRVTRSQSRQRRALHAASVTFHDLPYNVTPRQPPGHGCRSCKTLPVSTSWSSPTTPHSFLFSVVCLLRLLRLQLTRPLVLLNLQTFRIFTKLWGCLRKREYARKGLHGSFHAAARDSQTCRHTDSQLATTRPLPSLSCFLSLCFHDSSGH